MREGLSWSLVVNTWAWFLLPAVTCAAVSAFLFWKGIWPKREGRTPYCRKCCYNLTGIDSSCCPECGTPITPASTLHGERSPRPRRIMMGTVLLIAAVAWLLSSDYLASVDWRTVWYSWLSTKSLLNRMEAGDPYIQSKTFKVLRRRAETDADSQKALVQTCLNLADTDSWYAAIADMRSYLAGCYMKGQLPQKDANRFLKDLFKEELWVRSRVVKGDPVPYEEISSARAFSGDFYVRIKRDPILVDGVSTDVDGAVDNVHIYSPEYGVVTCDKPGRHVLSRRVVFELLSRGASLGGATGSLANPVLCYTTTLSAKAPFEILAERPPDYIRTVKDDSLKSRIKDSIHVSYVHERPEQDGVDVAIYVPSIDPTPVNVAFDVLVRIEKTEHLIGYLCAPKAGHPVYSHPCRSNEILYNWIDWKYTGPPFDSCEVVLRSNEQLARRTVDLFEIWEGAIVYSDVNTHFYPRERHPDISTPTEDPLPSTQTMPSKERG